MDFKKLTNQAQEQAAEVTAAAQKKIDAVIDEFNNLLPVVEKLGFRVESFNIEAGVLPTINTSLIGSIDSINDEAVGQIIAENKNNKLLIAVLNSVLMTKSIHQRLKGAYISILKDLVIDIQLGIPPKISCRFQ